MASLNHINLDQLERVAREAAVDRSKLKRTQQVAGEWLLAADGPQFRAEVSYEKGKVTLEADQPSTLGGWGTRLGPLHYCFFGLSSCYTATFATVASQMGIELKRLTTRVEGKLNFARVFGLSQEPIMEEVNITLTVESDAPAEKLEELERLASERCPAVFALTQPVKLNTALEISRG